MPAEAASGRTWYVVSYSEDFSKRQCEISALTPQQFATHWGAGPIRADHVTKSANGDLDVFVDVNANGKTIVTEFVTSMALCRPLVELPGEALHDDIN